MESVAVKRCTKCGQDKPRNSEFFHRHGKAKDGLRPDCKECVRQYLRHRYDGETPLERESRNKERYQIYKGRYEPTWRKIQADPEKREREKLRQRAKMRRFRAENPEKARALHLRYVGKRLGLAGDVTNSTVLELFQKQKGECYYCNCKVGKSKGRALWHIDHAIPISRGGTNDPANLVVACASCNLAKATKTPWEFMPERFAPPT